MVFLSPFRQMPVWDAKLDHDSFLQVFLNHCSPIILAFETPMSFSESNQVFGTLQTNSSVHSLVFSLEGRAWQEPGPSHVTGMALAHCILGKFLGVVCHCFPPPLDVPTLAARCLRPQRRERS